MQISAIVLNSPGHHTASGRTGETAQALAVAPKPGGGSAVNGGRPNPRRQLGGAIAKVVAARA
jgi:hypothetical protein